MNLIGQFQEPLRSDLRGQLAEAVQGWTEIALTSKRLVRAEPFCRFGLTDTAIAETSPGACLVLTDDRALAGLLEARRLNVILFSDLQDVCL